MTISMLPLWMLKTTSCLNEDDKIDKDGKVYENT